MTDATAPPRRRFWQIHLSTVVILPLLYGVVLWFVFDERPCSDKMYPHYYRGWPYVICDAVRPSPMFEVVSMDETTIRLRPRHNGQPGVEGDFLQQRFPFSLTNLIIDALLALIPVGMAGLCIEFLIGRRERHRCLHREKS